jgi:large subunit ribosomal protein L24
MRREEKVRHVVSIRKGDQVRVMTGRDAGKTGRVLSVDPFQNTVTVEHAGIIKRHTRPNPAKNVKGGIVEREGAIHISNVLLVCPSCRRHARTGHARLADGTRTRICRRCGATLEK